jgi:putative ABC transport system permease protein
MPHQNGTTFPQPLGPVSISNTARTLSGRLWLERLWQDLKFGCRMLVKNPGFTIVAVISLALGIGANCAIFSWSDALLLRPLTVPEPGEIMTVGSTTMLETFTTLVTSYRDYVDIRDRNTSFEGLAAFSNTTVGMADKPDAVPRIRLGMLVSSNFFDVMRVAPELGRAFRPEEHSVPGRDAVMILGHDLWERQFGADPSVLGRRVRLNGIEFTVVGVMPVTFRGMSQFVRSDFFIPFMMWPSLVNDPKVRPLEARDFRNVNVKGRLKRGVSMTQAQTEMAVIGQDLERAYPDTNKNRSLAVRTELQARIAQDPPDANLILMLTTLAAAVLFVACANVAGLLTSRAPSRAREIALRLSIGAGRSRVIRQLITESLLVSVIGGVLGLGVGYAGVSLFRQIQLPTDLPIGLDFQLDRRALIFSIAVSVVSALLFGVAPAFRTTRTDLTAVMKSSDTVDQGRRRRWGTSVLVVGQVAVSVVLLALATYMYRGFLRQLAAGPGYRLDHLVMMSFDPTLVRYNEADTQRFFNALIDRARAVPGVKTATLTTSVPMANDQFDFLSIVPEGFQLPAGKENVGILGTKTDERYFDTMAIPLVRGRGFREEDADGAPRVAVVNEQVAQHYWPGQDPIGKRFRLNDNKGPWVEIVGVAKNAKYIFLLEPPTEFVYLPRRQNPWPRTALVVQSVGDPASLVAPLREVVHSLDPNQPMFNVRTMEEFYQLRTISVFRIVIGTVAAMGLMGLGLSIVGLYGLVSYAANRRTKEIGIRMAIGAGRGDVLRMVLRQGALLAAVGLSIGLAGSVGAGRLLRVLFPGGRGTDPVALMLLAPIVFAVTLLAAYIPARRASRLDPTKALRYE